MHVCVYVCGSTTCTSARYYYYYTAVVWQLVTAVVCGGANLDNKNPVKESALSAGRFLSAGLRSFLVV